MQSPAELLQQSQRTVASYRIADLQLLVASDGKLAASDGTSAVGNVAIPKWLPQHDWAVRRDGMGQLLDADHDSNSAIVRRLVDLAAWNGPSYGTARVFGLPPDWAARVRAEARLRQTPLMRDSQVGTRRVALALTTRNGRRCVGAQWVRRDEISQWLLDDSRQLYELDGVTLPPLPPDVFGLDIGTWDRLVRAVNDTAATVRQAPVKPTAGGRVLVEPLLIGTTKDNPWALLMPHAPPKTETRND